MKIDDLLTPHPNPLPVDTGRGSVFETASRLRPRSLRFLLTALIAAGCAVPAGKAQAQPVTVKDAWVRAPAPGEKGAGAYMELVSRTGLGLTAVASPAAAGAR